MDDKTGLELLQGEVRGMLADAQRDPNGVNARILALYNAVKQADGYLEGLAEAASASLAAQVAALDERKAEVVAARAQLDTARQARR